MDDAIKQTLWLTAFRNLWRETKPTCGHALCSGTGSLWRWVGRRPTGTILQDVYYCGPECLGAALTSQLKQLEQVAPKAPLAGRIPLGLLMVARGFLSYTEVVAALEAQRRARYGTVGEWIEKLGFATEQDVTSALGLQWGCPVASSLETGIIPPSRQIPLAILEVFRMLPLQYAAKTETLYLACGQRVDYAALYTIERIIGCRTQPCVGGRKQISCQLERLRQQPQAHEVEFGPVRDVGEMSRIGLSYITKLGAEDVRLGRIGSMIWLRLKTPSSCTNLVFRLPVLSQHTPGFIAREIPLMSPARDVL